MILTSTTDMTNAKAFILTVGNYHQLLPFQRSRLRNLLWQHFHTIPQEEGDEMYVEVQLIVPTHVGIYSRRTENLIFQLRAAIDPALQFEFGFRY